MDHQITFAPDLGLNTKDFAAHWNETPECYALAKVQFISKPSLDFALDPESITQGLLLLTGLVGGLTLDALKDPNRPKPLALQVPMARRNPTARSMAAQVRPSTTINLLVVTARPGGANDVGYRTISRPLVESLHQSQLRVRVEILRPGTYEAMVKHLETIRETHGAGYYHVIHLALFEITGAPGGG